MKSQRKSFKIFDISRPLGSATPLYPGNSPVVLTRLKYINRDGSNLSGLSLGLHSGSHLDAPAHYLKGGRSVEKIELRKCLGWCRLIDCSRVKQAIDERDIKQIRPQAGETILFKTKNSRPPRTKRFNKNFIYLNEATARLLVKAKIRAVGIDGPSIRKFRLRPDTVHPLFLRAGVLIYEGLNFQNIPADRYFFIGLPLKVGGGEASPVRAILIKA